MQWEERSSSSGTEQLVHGLTVDVACGDAHETTDSSHSPKDCAEGLKDYCLILTGSTGHIDDTPNTYGWCCGLCLFLAMHLYAVPEI